MIWGIDPASKKVAMFTDDQGLIRAHVREVSRTNRNDELLGLRHWMESLLQYDPDPVLYCEEPVVAGARNLRSTILVAETVGMILALNARVNMVPVSSWKKGTVGNGNATKDQVTEWLKREHSGYASYCRDTQQRESQDLRDAAAIYIYGRGLEVSG